MLSVLFNVILAAAVALFQASFLSRLPSPLSDLPIVLVVSAWLILRNRPDAALGWLLLGGLVLDLQQPYGFGTELTLGLVVFALMRFLFVRVLSGGSLAAAFLLAAAGALARYVGLAVIDGGRVLFGRDPYLLIWEPALVTRPLLAALTAGASVVILVALTRRIEGIMTGMFLRARSRLKL